MEEMIAYCGLNCYECNAYVATQENDDDKRAAVAKEWSALFKEEIRTEDIHCDGCRSEEGRHFNYCEVCQIRSCGTDKEVENCASCIEYPCEKLDFIHKSAPHAKERLDEIKTKKIKVEVE